MSFVGESRTLGCVGSAKIDPKRHLQRLTNVAGSLAVLILATACAPDAAIAPRSSPETLSASIDAASSAFALSTSSMAFMPYAVPFSTYDGSGEVVHPDVVSLSREWNGRRIWNVITPYAKSNSGVENPSLFGSDVGENWTIPQGGSNPLARTTRGYLSDPDMVFDSTSNEMWLYYREVENRYDKRHREYHVADHVWVIKSEDATHWSAPRRVTSDTGRFVVSPSVIHRGDMNWLMYSIDAGRDGCSAKSSRVMMRQSPDGISWKTAVPISLTQPGYVAWHLDAQWVPSRNEYWALVAAYKAAQGCTATSLFLATSADGLKWTTYPAPVLARGEYPPFSAAVYRSTFAIDTDDNITIWYSGARVATAGTKKQAPVLSWSAAMSRNSVDALLVRVRDGVRASTVATYGGASGGLRPPTIAP